MELRCGSPRVISARVRCTGCALYPPHCAMHLQYHSGTVAHCTMRSWYRAQADCSVIRAILSIETQAYRAANSCWPGYFRITFSCAIMTRTRID